MHATPNIAHRLDLIVCPQCRGPLTLADNNSSLACTLCARRYILQDGIPVLIPVLIPQRATS